MRKNKSISCYIFLIFLFLSINIKGYCETIYFLVGEKGVPVHNDSYVVLLTEPNDIAHARDLINFGPGIGRNIVVAQIEFGMDGINRDYLSAYKTLWSWHVTSFINFADITAEILDGWPGGVLDYFTSGSLIGFWSYTISSRTWD